jgi:hypothetical protein
MRAVALPTAAIALVGFAVSAQEFGRESSESEDMPPHAVAAPVPSAGEPRWSESADSQSSLLTQLTAVVRARRAAALAEAGVAENTVQVTAAMNDEIVTREENCRQMPAPGSRILSERCFNETDPERRLNEYQFDEELRFARQEALRRQLEDAMRAEEAARRAAGVR